MASKRQYFRLAALMILFHLSVSSNGQSGFMEFLTRPTTIKLQAHAIDDDRNTYKGLFSLSSWSKSYIPSRIVVGKTIQDKFKIDLGLSYLKMSPLVYRERYIAPGTFFNTDLNVRYQINLASSYFDKLYVPRGNSFLNAISNMGFNIYPIVGLGYTNRSQTVYKNSINLNFGGGFTLWFVRNRLGLNVESQGKMGIDSRMPIAGSNYFHHSAGLVIVTKSSNYIGRSRRGIQRTRIKF